MKWPGFSSGLKQWLDRTCSDWRKGSCCSRSQRHKWSICEGTLWKLQEKDKGWNTSSLVSFSWNWMSLRILSVWHYRYWWQLWHSGWLHNTITIYYLRFLFLLFSFTILHVLKLLYILLHFLKGNLMTFHSCVMPQVFLSISYFLCIFMLLLFQSCKTEVLTSCGIVW